MSIGTVGELCTIANGLPIILFGFALMRKKNKTEEEERAAKSFQCFFSLTCIITGLAAIVLAVAVFVSLAGDTGAGFSSVERYGTVKGDSVRYVQNTMKYIGIEELGLDPAVLEEGDRVILFFDSRDDTLIGAVSDKAYKEDWNRRLLTLLGSVSGSVLILVIWALAARCTVGREFSIFYALYHKRGQDAVWCQDSRQSLYEKLFIKTAGKGTLFLKNLFYAVYCLIFIVGVSVAGVLVIGEVYALTADQGLVNATRLLGVISCLLYIFLMILGAWAFEKKITPLYANKKNLEATRLLQATENGPVGYHTAQNEWVELKKIRIRKEDAQIVKAKCTYLNAAKGVTISENNFIAKNDPVYLSVLPMVKQSRKKRSSVGLWFIILSLALLLMSIMLASNLRLLDIRDRSTFSFSSRNTLYEEQQTRGMENNLKILNGHGLIQNIVLSQQPKN